MMPRGLRLAAVLAGLLCAGGSAAQAGSTARSCEPDPLAGRALYLRGTMNSWNAVETQRFTWACTRWEFVGRVSGEHRFKIADEAWSPDADFGGPGPRLALKGPELQRRFDAAHPAHRFTLTMQDKTPELRIEPCPQAAPLGDTVLFLRGTMNNWAAIDEYAFQYSCDAYYLNVKLEGRHDFKVADASWREASTFGAGDSRANHVLSFSGEHTLRLAFEGPVGTDGKRPWPKLTIGPRTFADPQAKGVDDPVALSLRFHSRRLEHKAPFGAIVPGTEMAFSVDAAPGVESLTLVVERRRLEGNQELLEYSELARTPMQRSAVAPGSERFSARHRFDAVGVYGYWFEARIGGKRFALQNNTDAVPWTREKGSGGRSAVAELPATPALMRLVRRFRQTVHAADFQVPAWASDIVYYQIFPERFRNGDPSNDPRPGVARFKDQGVERHKSWNERPFKPGSGDGSDGAFNNDFFGGDLAGITAKLDELKDLGVNTLYLTPVFKAPSNHKYDTADFLHIDPAFGSNAEFTRLAQEAAQRGMRVIPDTSLNHVGSDSIYFNRFGNFAPGGAFDNGRINATSPYASWFKFDATQKDPEKQYLGWVGIADLPELDKASPAWRRFAYGGKDAVTQLWLDRGAAGWRMDVAPWVPDDFWREWRRALKAHRPDAMTIAEAWFDSSKYLLGDMFDSTMNYVFRDAALDFANGGKATQLAENLELMREHYPRQALYAQMNLISSHDVPRALHVLGWQADPGMPPATEAQIAAAKQRLLLATMLQMTYPGAPTVYYGDEVGVTGGPDPYNRATYPWADQGGKPDLALRARMKALIRLRNAQPVLRQGSIDAPLLADEHVLVFHRRLGDQWALVALNNAGTDRAVEIALPAGAPVRWRNGLDAAAAQREAAAGRISLRLPPLAGLVLLAP